MTEEEKKQKRREYLEKNKEKIKERQKEYRKNNPEKFAGYQRKWRKKKALLKEQASTQQTPKDVSPS